MSSPITQRGQVDLTEEFLMRLAPDLRLTPIDNAPLASK